MDNSRFSNFKLDLNPEMHFLFGFLLDSIEGLASHTRIPGSEALFVCVSPDQKDSFDSFVQAWSAYIKTQDARVVSTYKLSKLSGKN